MNRTVFFLLMMGALTARADILGSGGDWGLIESLSPAGGTMTGPVCWYDTSSSVCIDSTTAGQLSIYGSGATNDEDLVCDVETTANVIALSSSTGVTQITAAGMDIKPDTLTLGAGGQLGAGSGADDQFCLYEADTPGDVSCLRTNDNTLYFVAENGSTRRNIVAGSVSGTGTFTTTNTGGFISSAANGGRIFLTDATTPGVVGDNSAVVYQGQDSVENTHIYARTRMEITDPATTAEYADLIWYATTNGVDTTEYMRLDSSAGAIVAAKPITVGAGGQWKAGTSDDMVCLQEVGVAADQICLQTVGDEIYFLQGNGTARARGVFGELYVSGALVSNNVDGIESYNVSGGSLIARDSTPTGDTNGTASLRFQANDAGGVEHEFGRIKMQVTAAGAGIEYADMLFESTTNGVDATEYMRIDSSDGQVEFAQSIQLTPTVSATPAAPVTCGTDTLGNTTVVNDSDDGAGTEVCYCGMTDDSTYDWLDMSDNSACTHF